MEAIMARPAMRAPLPMPIGIPLTATALSNLGATTALMAATKPTPARKARDASAKPAGKFPIR